MGIQWTHDLNGIDIDKFPVMYLFRFLSVTARSPGGKKNRRRQWQNLENVN